MISLGFIILLVLVAIFAPLLTALIGHGPNAQYTNTGLSLSGIPVGPGHNGFLLGTDDQGRDVLSRIIYGSRISLEVGVGATALALVIGMLMGLVAGYYGGWIDAVLGPVHGHPALLPDPALRPRHRGALRSEPPAGDLRDRPVQLALHRPAGARPGDQPPRTGVRRGGARARLERPADHVRRHRAQPDRPGGHLRDAAHPGQHRARGDAELPRPRRSSRRRPRGET